MTTSWRRVLGTSLVALALFAFPTTVSAQKKKPGGGGDGGGGTTTPVVRPAPVPPAAGTLVWPEYGQNSQNSGKSPWLGCANGNRAWRLALGQASHGPAIDLDGTIYLSTGQGLASLNPQTGDLYWIREDLASEGTPAIGSDGVVYATDDCSSAPAVLNAVNPITGETLSSFVVESTVFCGSPKRLLTGAGEQILVVSHEGDVYAVNPATMTVDWQYAMGARSQCTPAVAADGTIYVTCDGAVHALSSDGSFKWSYRLNGPVCHPVVGLDNTVYVGSEGDGSLSALTAAGALKWKVTVAQRDKGWSGPIPLGHPALDEFYDAVTPGTLRTTIYIGTKSGLQAVNGTGSLKWKYSTPGNIQGTPVVGADGIVYVCYHNGTYGPSHNLFALQPEGTLIWSAFVGSSSMGSQPALAADGTLYVGGDGLRAFHDLGTDLPVVGRLFAGVYDPQQDMLVRTLTVPQGVTLTLRAAAISASGDSAEVAFSRGGEPIAVVPAFVQYANDIAGDTLAASFDVDTSSLAPGQYTFAVQAKDSLGQLSNTPAITITVTAP